MVRTTLDARHGLGGRYGTGCYVRDAKLDASGTEVDHEVGPKLATTDDGKALAADDTEGIKTWSGDVVVEAQPDDEGTKPAVASDEKNRRNNIASDWRKR